MDQETKDKTTAFVLFGVIPLVLAVLAVALGIF